MQRILDYLKQNQARFVNELCDYIRFPSVSAQPQHEADLRACAEWVVKHCREIGLETELCPTARHPIVLAKTPPGKANQGARRPRFVVYGHYDVQPPEPLDEWESPPFEPRLDGRFLFGRGTSDNKGQHLAHLKAVEAYLHTGTELPCDLVFVIEGEEEVGSVSLTAFLEARRAELACDAVVVSDSGLPALDCPALTYALRGIVGFEVFLQGPARDLHSGIFGGTVDNPALALCQLLARLRDKNGRITIPGFYDDVRPLSAQERKQLARLPFNERKYRRLLGVPQLFGERGYTPTEQSSARPTFEINGLTSGYQGEGSKTIIPAWARAKITARLVPDQKPARILRLIRQHLKQLCPPSVKLKIEDARGAEPYLVSPTSAHAQAALRALRTAFGHEPVLVREGGSIPIINHFKKWLRADSLMLGLALPNANAHAPNESFHLDCFAKGQVLSACLWQELSGI